MRDRAASAWHASCRTAGRWTGYACDEAYRLARAPTQARRNILKRRVDGVLEGRTIMQVQWPSDPPGQRRDAIKHLSRYEVILSFVRACASITVAILLPPLLAAGLLAASDSIHRWMERRFVFSRRDKSQGTAISEILGAIAVVLIPVFIFVVEFGSALLIFFNLGGTALRIALILTAILFAVYTLFSTFIDVEYIDSDRNFTRVRGVFNDDHVTVPIDRIIAVNAHSGVIAKMFGVGKISLDTSVSDDALIHRWWGLIRKPNEWGAIIEKERDRKEGGPLGDE